MWVEVKMDIINFRARNFKSERDLRKFSIQEGSLDCGWRAGRRRLNARCQGNGQRFTRYARGPAPRLFLKSKNRRVDGAAGLSEEEIEGCEAN